MSSDAEVMYLKNAQKCRAIGHYLELLVEEMKYYDEMLDAYNKELTLIKMTDAKASINELFDIQLDLYFEIAYENERRSRAILMERMRMFKSTKTRK